MNPAADDPRVNHSELPYLYILQALAASELPAAEKHIAECPKCRREIEMLRPVVDALPAWPTDVLRPPVSLWDRLEGRVAKEARSEPSGLEAPYEEPAWKEVAPDISCQLRRVEVSGSASNASRLRSIGAARHGSRPDPAACDSACR